MKLQQLVYYNWTFFWHLLLCFQRLYVIFKSHILVFYHLLFFSNLFEFYLNTFLFCLYHFFLYPLNDLQLTHNFKYNILLTFLHLTLLNFLLPGCYLLHGGFCTFCYPAHYTQSFSHFQRLFDVFANYFEHPKVYSLFLFWSLFQLASHLQSLTLFFLLILSGWACVKGANYARRASCFVVYIFILLHHTTFSIEFDFQKNYLYFWKRNDNLNQGMLHNKKSYS